jgi:predicted MPP superfamily phosphohydrolase
LRRVLIALTALGLALLAFMYAEALRAPVVREESVAYLPPGSDPFRILLIGDVHVAGPDMPPSRLAGIVAELSDLEADLILIAGDLVSDKTLATKRYSAAEAVAPLAGFSTPLLFVPGNHDHWRGFEAFERPLAKAGITVLRNQVLRFGPVMIAGIDDDFSGNADIAKAFAALPENEIPVIALTHSPDIVPALPSKAGLVLAGHTHCGQIRPPFVGAISYASRHGARFGCGVIDETGRRIFVTAGLGTSILPLRLGAPPDVWLITLTALPE